MRPTLRAAQHEQSEYLLEDQIQQPVGAENPDMSCDLHIFVNEAAQSVSSERPDGRPGTWRSGACGRVLMQ
jgi:hypothetical protein